MSVQTCTFCGNVIMSCWTKCPCRIFRKQLDELTDDERAWLGTFLLGKSG